MTHSQTVSYGVDHDRRPLPPRRRDRDRCGRHDRLRRRDPSDAREHERARSTRAGRRVVRRGRPQRRARVEQRRGTGRARARRRASPSLDRCAPPFVRRLVEVALVGSCIVGSAVPASATSRAKRRDIPVVRAPAAVTTTTTTRPTTTTRHLTPTSTTTVPSPAPTTAPAAASRPLPPAPLPRTKPSHRTPSIPSRIAPTSRSYTVRAGDNLWTIARAALGPRRERGRRRVVLAHAHRREPRARSARAIRPHLPGRDRRPARSRASQ